MALRLIQVGMGGWGRSWAKNIVSQSADVVLEACVDTMPEMLEHAQQSVTLPRERYFTSLEDALSSVACDAVLITASLPAHIPSALTALRAGKHVLLEKPFAPTLEEAQSAIDLAREQRRVLMVSQNYRFYAAPRAVAELVREERLGPVGTVEVRFRRYFNTAPPGSWNYYTIWQPLLSDMAIHHFDLMRLVLGQEPKEVSCAAWNPPWSHYDGPASALATIQFTGGTVVNYSGSWVSTAPHTHWGGEWRIECEKGEILWASRDDQMPDELLIRPQGKRTRRVKLTEPTFKDRHGTLHAFVEAVRSGQEPETSGRDNIKTLALLFALVTASESNCRVSVESILQQRSIRSLEPQ